MEQHSTARMSVLMMKMVDLISLKHGYFVLQMAAFSEDGKLSPDVCIKDGCTLYGIFRKSATKKQRGKL